MPEAPIIKQLAAANVDVIRARKHLADALERRNRRVHEAADQEIPIRAIGRAANLSVGGVFGILSKPATWADEIRSV